MINEKVVWGTMWKQIMIDPPDPELVGESWREMWLVRLRAQGPVVSEWMRHQLVDQYWRDRITTDYSKIKCAVYVIGGLEDSYINTVPRTLERLSCPRKGIVGSWGHDWPQDGDPGPRLDWAVVFGYLLGGDPKDSAMALNVVYNFADFLNKIAFGVIIWAAAVSESDKR